MLVIISIANYVNYYAPKRVKVMEDFSELNDSEKQYYVSHHKFVKISEDATFDENGDLIAQNMSKDDIDKAVKEAAEFEAQDKKRKEAIDTRNNADSMVFQVENALKEAGDKIDANDKAAVEADLNALKDLLSQTANAEEMTDADVAELKSLQEKLTQSAQKVFAKMYEQTQQAVRTVQYDPQCCP